jgi:hypothetical protein
MYLNFDHQMSLSKSKCSYSNYRLHFSKRTIPLYHEKKFPAATSLTPLFQVTETTTEKVIHSPDGNISRDVVYVKETSESSGETGGKASSGFFSSLAKLLFLVLIAGVAIFLYSVSCGWSRDILPNRLFPNSR